MKSKILLVDDEPDILELLRYNLENEGYDVFLAGDGEEALRTALHIRPDLILLDVMMPQMDGIETCMELKKRDELGQTLIAFLTARGEDYSQIAGLEAGADDYITKPIKPRVLISRVKALLRRSGSGNNLKTASDGLNDISVNRERFIAYLGDKELTLPRKEFELLALLLSKPGKVFTRNEILTGVWGDEVIVGDRTIDVHVRKLREKIGEEKIATVKGIGYKYQLSNFK